MSIGYITGPLLSSNLDRQGKNLQFTTNSAPLLYLDFTNFQVGVNQPTISGGATFSVNGSALLGNTLVSDTIISATKDMWLTTSTGNITVAPNLRFIAPFSTISGLKIDNTTISSSTNISLAPTGSTNIGNTIVITGNTIFSSANLTISAFRNGITVGNITVNGSALSTTNSSNLSVSGTKINNLGYPIIGTDAASAQFVWDQIAPLSANSISSGTSSIVVSGAQTSIIVSGSTIATFNNNSASIDGFTFGNNVVSTVGNLTIAPTGNVNFSNVALTNVGYSTLSNSAATVQYVTDSISSLSPNTIWQANSSVTVTDSGNSGLVSVNIDGVIAASFSNTVSTIANLSVTNTTISSNGSITLTPGINNIVAVNSTSALQVPVGTSANRPSSPQAGYVRFNLNSNTMEVYNGTAWISAQATVTSQILAGNGVSATYPITQPAAPDNLLVMINGVVQLPFTAYTTSGSFITFAEIPLVTETIEIRTISMSVSGVATLQSSAIVDPTSVIVNSAGTIIDSFSSSAYGAVEYKIYIKYTDNTSQFVEVLFSQDGINTPTYTIRNTSVTNLGSNSLSFTAQNVSGVCSLTAFSSEDGTRVKIQKTYFTI